jgi:hypothetical protein
LPAETQEEGPQWDVQDCQQVEGLPVQVQHASCAGVQHPAMGSFGPAGAAQQVQPDMGLPLHAQRAGANSSHQHHQRQQLNPVVSGLQADRDAEQGLVHAQQPLQDGCIQDVQSQHGLVLRQSAQQAGAQVVHAQDEQEQLVQQPNQGPQMLRVTQSPAQPQDVQLPQQPAQHLGQQGCQLQQQSVQQPAQQLQPAQHRNSVAWAQQPMRLSDMDPEVLASLPWDIQLEVQQQLRANRAGSTVTQPSRRGRGGAKGRVGAGSGRRQQQQRHGSIHKYLSK